MEAITGATGSIMRLCSSSTCTVTVVEQSIRRACRRVWMRRDGTDEAYQRRQQWSRGIGRKIAAQRIEAPKRVLVLGPKFQCMDVWMYRHVLPSPALWGRRAGSTSQGYWARRSIKLIPSIKSPVSLPYNTMSCVWESLIWNSFAPLSRPSVCSTGQPW